MPLIDYDLHPMAMAFGIFCFLLTSGLLATVVYVSLQTPAADAQQPATLRDKAFVPSSSGPLQNDTTSPQDTQRLDEDRVPA